MKEIKIGHIYDIGESYVIPIYEKKKAFLGFILGEDELQEVQQGDYIDLLVQGIQCGKYVLYPIKGISIRMLLDLDSSIDYLPNTDLMNPLIIVQDFIDSLEPYPEKIPKSRRLEVSMLLDFFGADIQTTTYFRIGVLRWNTKYE